MSKTLDLEQLKYPVGKYLMPDKINLKHIMTWVDTISSFPEEMEDKLKGVKPTQLKWKYRPEGWSIQQVVHHCADSHMNAYIRFKLALTEDSPVIKPYREDLWAELSDTKDVEIEESLSILSGLHRRWARLLHAMDVEDYDKVFVHPEYNKQISIAENIGLYDWHCRHHLGHISQALASEGKY